MSSSNMKLVCVSIQVIIALLIAAPTFADEACDKNECLGPLGLYDDIKCKPIYEKEGDCCASSYDCSHLQARKKDKCYIGLDEYNHGDSPKPGETGACDFDCTCTDIESYGSKFDCAAVDCPKEEEKLEENCYSDFSENACCGVTVCSKAGEAETCKVGEKTYKLGELFYVPWLPELDCQCLPGFKGEFVEPYCSTLRCGHDLHNSPDNIRGCAPVMISGSESVRWNCRMDTKCPDPLDYVVKGTEQKTDDKVCKFGEHTLHIGDKLMNNGTGVSNECLECTCEVPPFLTCIQTPEDDCEKLKKNAER